MRDEDVRPFLRAIHDRPADDLPRLIFADYLDEHGDWRGPLLRRPAPPGPTRDAAATDAWLDRLGKLHGVGWVACRRGLLSVVTQAAVLFELGDSHLLKGAFRQGWVEHLDVLDNANMPSWVEQLDLSELPRLGLQTADDEALEYLPPLPAVRELYLNNCTATRTELEWLNEFPRLEHLHVDLTLSPSEDFVFNRLRTAPHLRSLRLVGHLLTNATLDHVGRLSGLRKLDLRAGQATDVGLVYLEGQAELEDLRIGSAWFTDEALEFFQHLPRLRTLDLSGCLRISDQGIARLRANRPDLVVRR
jgi:uncharacterized protein (TIGR02996 family)